MDFLLGFATGFVVGVIPQTRALVYAGYARAKAYAKRRGWLAP